MNTFLRSFSIIQHLNPNGHHVGGLVGYLKSVGYAIRLYQPTRVVLVFDGQGNSTNKQYLYPDYKANRSTTKVNNWKIFSDKAEESESMANLPVAIALLKNSGAGNIGSQGPLMAFALLISLPTILLYFVTQKHFVRGIALSGLK